MEKQEKVIKEELSNEKSLKEIKKYEKVKSFFTQIADKDGLNIEELTEDRIEKFLKSYIVKNPYKIFELEKEEVNEILKESYKDAEKVYDSIQNSRRCPLDRFIYATCIPNIDKLIAHNIAYTFFNFADFVVDLNNGAGRIKNIDGVNKEVVDSIYNNKKLLGNLFMYVSPLKIRNPEEKIKVAITGFFYKPNSYYEELVENAGFQLCNDVEDDLDYLVAGDLSNANMMSLAHKKRVKIISEEQLREIIEQDQLLY